MPVHWYSPAKVPETAVSQFISEQGGTFVTWPDIGLISDNDIVIAGAEARHA